MRRAGRFPVATGDIRVDARRELRWAMGGCGLTPDKVAAMTTVLALPEVRAACAASPHPVAATAFDAIVAAARALGGSVQARMLRVALAVDYDGKGKDLTSRRAEFVRTHNDAVRADGRRDVLPESPRAAFEVENELLDSLVTILGAPPERHVS